MNVAVPPVRDIEEGLQPQSLALCSETETIERIMMMKHLNLPSVRQIPSSSDTIYAFEITGHVSDDDAEALAEHTNDAFDKNEKVNMLMKLDGYTGSDKDAIFDGEVIESRWRSLFNIENYAVIGAPDGASKMITVMDKILPVNAKSFASHEEAMAWEFVGAKAV